MNIKEYIQQGFTAITATISSLACFAAIMDLQPVPVVISAAFAGISGYGFKYYREKYLKKETHLKERKLLELFSYQRNALSVGQVALITAMPIDEIQDTMDGLQRKGVIEIVLTETGAILYQLPEYQHSNASYLGGF